MVSAYDFMIESGEDSSWIFRETLCVAVVQPTPRIAEQPWWRRFAGWR
jgi:hypothetical protein